MILLLVHILGRKITLKNSLGGIVTIALVILSLTAVSVYAAPNQNIQVSFINVGQGDSALIRDTNGFDVLIDGGKTSAGPTVVAYLREQSVDDIEVMVVSHADSDHIGGLIDVLEATDIPVESVIYSGYSGDTLTWSDFVTAVANEGITMTVAQYPQTFTWGETTAHILNPEPGLVNPETNDASVVVLLENGSNRFLFPGDIDSTIEATVVARGTPVAAQILKVAHHGSAYSSSEDFLAAVQPQEAIISVGDNSYGHPAEETIARLLAAGARVWRTDQNGTIWVSSDGVAYQIASQYGGITYLLYLPLTSRDYSAPLPTPTPTTPSPEPTITPTTPVPTETTPPPPTDTPTPTPATTGNVQIIDIFYDGAGSTEPDEHVDIRNDDSKSIQLQSWTLRDEADHVYTFPSFVIQPGQVCRVYTNESHPEWCSFNYGSGSAIWNNTGDCAYLRDGGGNQVDQYCY
jgi:competence protein ComEC